MAHLRTREVSPYLQSQRCRVIFTACLFLSKGGVRACAFQSFSISLWRLAVDTGCIAALQPSSSVSTAWAVTAQWPAKKTKRNRQPYTVAEERRPRRGGQGPEAAVLETCPLMRDHEAAHSRAYRVSALGPCARCQALSARWASDSYQHGRRTCTQFRRKASNRLAYGFWPPHVRPWWVTSRMSWHCSLPLNLFISMSAASVWDL